MLVQTKTLEMLRDLINEKTEYRSGPQLVKFFNELGFSDIYGQGFPSRWLYTDEKLSKINGSIKLDECIKKVFAPISFVGRVAKLDELIKEFNNYLCFDKWQVIRKNNEITFKRLDEVIIPEDNSIQPDEDDFLHKEFSEISLSKFQFENALTDILEMRLNEIKIAVKNEAPLTVIILTGSLLEGILLGVAFKKMGLFQSSLHAPKNKQGQVLELDRWTLSHLIEVAYDLNLIELDVKEYSIKLKDFRNYVHAHRHLVSKFDPSMRTVQISLQVLKAAMYQLSSKLF